MNALGHLAKITDIISITVTEMVEGEVEARLLVPQRIEICLIEEGKFMFWTR